MLLVCQIFKNAGMALKSCRLPVESADSHTLNGKARPLTITGINHSFPGIQESSWDPQIPTNSALLAASLALLAKETLHFSNILSTENCTAKVQRSNTAQKAIREHAQLFQLGICLMKELKKWPKL